jgi:anti-sigma factor RsiW
MTSPPFDRAPPEVLRRMLLGDLAEAEREELEARLLEDPELFEAYREAEGSLLDALVRGELPAEEARKLEMVFAASTEGRAKLAVARELAKGETRPARFRLLRFPSSPRGWMALAAMLVLAVLTGWLAVENQRLREQREDLDRRQGKPTVTLELPLALLTPRSERQDIPSIEVPATAANLALAMDLRGLPAHPAYRVRVRNPGGELVYAEAGLRPPEPESLVLEVTVPASAFAPGRHEVALDGETAEGGWELVAETPILIVRE